MAEQLSIFDPPKRKSGLLYLPNYLSITDQKDLLNDLRTVVRQSPLFTPTMSSGAPFRYKMTNIGDLGWNSDRQGYRYESKHPVTGQSYPEIPSSLRSMIDDLSGKFGERIRPDAVLLNWYPDGAKLGLHVDNTEKVSKPVVSLSLGDRGVFAIDTTGSRDRSTAMKNLERINVNSGDAIVFGGDLRNAYHAVERIDAGTAPPELGMKNSGRINLTARQVNKIFSGGFGNPISKFAKGFAMREGARLLVKQLGADEQQQQAVADTVTVASVASSLANNSGVNNMAANKKINTGSLSTSIKEPKAPKLTSDILADYLKMMGGEPMLVRPDGSQYNPDRKGRVNIGDRMTTAEKFGQAADVGLSNDFMKLPEVQTRFDDRRLALQVQKELSTGRLTTQKFYEVPTKEVANQVADEIRRSPELLGRGESVEVRPAGKGFEVVAVKQYQPIPSRGNSLVRSYSLNNDPTGVYVAFNKPEEAYSAPKSLKELQADTRKAYQSFGLKPNASIAELEAAVQPIVSEIKNTPELRDRLATVLVDIKNRPELESVPLERGWDKVQARSPMTQQVMQQAAIASAPPQSPPLPLQSPPSKTKLALESDRIGGYQPKHIPKILEALKDEDLYLSVLGSMSLADQDRFGGGWELLEESGDKSGTRDFLSALNRARRNVPRLGGDMYDEGARQAFSQLDDSLGVKFGFNKTLKFGLKDFANSSEKSYRVDIPDQAKIELSQIKVDGKYAFRVDNIVAYNPEALGDRFAMKTLKFLQENLPKPVVMGNVINDKFARIFEKQGYVRQGSDFLPPELAPKQAIAPQQTLDTPSDSWKLPQSSERKLPNFYPQALGDDNPLGTGATVQSTYDRAKSAYQGYQDFGYAPRDQEFPSLRDMRKLAESEGVKGDEALKAYIKGKQNAPLIEAGVIKPPELPLTARLGQEYISPKTGKLGTVESVGKKGVKLSVDGQTIPVEYQTLERLKYTGNKGYGFSTPAALRPALGGLAAGTLGAIAFKQLAKAAGLNEDQQNIAAGVGGVTGAITGGSLSLFKPTTELKAPTPQQFARNVMGIPASSESGMFLTSEGRNKMRLNQLNQYDVKPVLGEAAVIATDLLTPSPYGIVTVPAARMATDSWKNNYDAIAERGLAAMKSSAIGATAAVKDFTYQTLSQIGRSAGLPFPTTEQAVGQVLDALPNSQQIAGMADRAKARLSRRYSSESGMVMMGDRPQTLSDMKKSPVSSDVYNLSQADKFADILASKRSVDVIRTALSLSDGDKFGELYSRYREGDKSLINEIIPYINKARSNVPESGDRVGSTLYEGDRFRKAFSEFDRYVGVNAPFKPADTSSLSYIDEMMSTASPNTTPYYTKDGVYGGHSEDKYDDPTKPLAYEKDNHMGRKGEVYGYRKGQIPDWDSPDFFFFKPQQSVPSPSLAELRTSSPIEPVRQSVQSSDRPQTLSELQAARRELDSKYPDSPRYDRTAKPEPRKPVPSLTFDQSADQMSMSPSEYRAFQDRVYAEQQAVQSKPYQERQNQIAKQKFQQEQSYFDALKAWNKAGDPTIPMPRKEDFVSPVKNTFDFKQTLSEASMAARSAESRAKGFGKSQPKSAIAQATQAIQNAGEIVFDALYQPSAANPSRASSPKQGNFIAEPTVEAAAKSSGASTAQIKAEIANQRASGETPNLTKATETIAQKSTRTNELVPRSLAEMQLQSKALSTRVLSRQQPDGMIATPSQGMIDAAMKQQNRFDLGDRVGASGLGIVMDTALAANVLTESVSRGEKANVALTRTGVSVGAGYAATGLASFIPNPYLRAAAQLGGGIAAVVGADKAIDQVVGRDMAREEKYGKDLSKLDLQPTNEKEQWKPFADDTNLAAAYGNSLANQIQQNLDYRPAARSLANLANNQAIENARLASERDTSIKAGMDAKAKKSIAFEKRDDGVEVGYIRDRGYKFSESRILALQNLANESGYEVPRTGKFNTKTLDALEKLGYSQQQVMDYLDGKTKAIGEPKAKPKTNQEQAKEAFALRSKLGRTPVTSSQLSQALSAERKAQGLKAGQTLDQGTVNSVFQSLAGRSLASMQKVGGSKTQSALRMGAGLR